MDRKEIIRRYKQTPRPMGIFQVRNTTNGKVFIGSSSDLPAMLNRQQAQLRFGSHPNRTLQKDWKELGPEAFSFEILDTIKAKEEPDYNPTADLRVLQEIWLEKLSPFNDRGYNERPLPGHS
jgi:hypothetical protein